MDRVRGSVVVASFAHPHQAWPSLHVNADLRSLFGWNTKQLFVSIEVDYVTEKHPHNSMVIWARIIKKQVCGCTALCYSSNHAISTRMRRSSS